MGLVHLHLTPLRTQNSFDNYRQQPKMLCDMPAKKSSLLITRQVAQKLNVHPETIKRWIRSGKVPAPATDRRGWFVFDEEDIRNAERFANHLNLPPHKLQRPLFPQGAAR